MRSVGSYLIVCALGESRNERTAPIKRVDMKTLIILAVALLPGCTATSFQQQEALARGIEGTYINGIGCTRLQMATGKAAGAAARAQQARQVQVDGKTR